MKLYLDDDSASPLLVRLRQHAGHDVQVPADLNLSGEDDAVHFRCAAIGGRAIVTGNYDDFLNLHHLVIQLQGHHAGVLVVRRDNDPKRDLSPAGVVTAMRKLLAANVPVLDQYIILNHWR
ncbi:MAG: DUF5615 family PIN-like protein [Planctomycetes bacterium]|jgi:hypothetical protein|nr:DUF5615 family PIN-like protein [Planctomycetota bacterium]